MKILAINCNPDLTYFKGKVDFQVDYKTTTQIFPYFIARAKNTALGTPDMYSPNPTSYLSQFKGYDFYIVCYDPKDYPNQFANTGGFTNSVPVNNGIWCTVRKDPYTNKYITHELMHCLVYYLNVIKGLNKKNETMVWDYMDSDRFQRSYYLNDFPDNPVSNFSQTWNEISKHLDLLKPMTTYKYFKPSTDPKMIGLKDELMRKLDTIREQCGFPLSITSGLRTLAENNALKDSVSDSSHLSGLACDLACTDSSKRDKLVNVAKANGITRIGIGNGFVHIDIDKSKPQNVMWTYY